LKELVLPLQQRIDDVREFLTDIDSSVNYEIVPIQDPFGPTITDPDMDLIVVSAETIKGGEKINSIRRSKNFRELAIHSIPLIEVKQLLHEKEGKVSSSNQRMDILGSQFRKPQPRPNLSGKPYSKFHLNFIGIFLINFYLQLLVLLVVLHQVKVKCLRDFLKWELA
jgi:phosphopantetheine adenylyltransferase / dephospho-CoA kinase